MSDEENARRALSEDLIVGANAIAKFVGLTRRQVYGCVEQGTLPTFKIGGLVCARRSTIMKWIEHLERRS